MELDSIHETMEFHVDGMTCAHCTNAVTEEVHRIDGVSDVAVDLEHHLVTVTGVELAPQVVLDAITRAGYGGRRA
jgi:copper chaperone CopZ